MPKIISKADLIRQINKIDALEIVAELVIRAQPAPHRKVTISKFIKEIEKHIQDERDVLLISVKIK